ncbi:MAG: M42 family metallopeptidase [Methylacidiphilales bacterium]|nr:M42 family metallopeptidase [Candidatus Methylacidiphilales bacterium]MDW8349836.1 M42 family metallopeptidase [Verrucomicrobiae bacterium]
MDTQQKEFLKQLLNTPSPSSGELALQRLWIEFVKPYADEIKIDAYGNAIAVWNPSGSPRIMVSGHGDEIGFIIQYINDQGFLYFTTVGGSDPALARGQRVHIHNSRGTVLGVIGSLAIHMQDREKENKVPAWHEMFIDIGAKDKNEALSKVAVGDLVTYAVGYEPIHDRYFIARGCDNRVGSFVAAQVLRRCAETKKSQAAVIAVSTIQEENGLYGAAMVGYSIHPDAALVVDVAQATDIPIADKKRFCEVSLGKGPTLNRGSANHPLLVEKLRQVAESHSIPFQWATDPRSTGTDADAIFRQRGGIPTAAIGLPNRYMHSPIEMLAYDDLDQCINLIQAFLEDINPDTSFAHQL